MSQENVEIVKRCARFWQDRDSSRIREVFDPDVEVDVSRNIFNPRVYRGIAGLDRMVAAVGEAWGEVRVDLDGFFDAGGHVGPAVTGRGEGPGSGGNGT